MQARFAVLNTCRDAGATSRTPVVLHGYRLTRTQKGAWHPKAAEILLGANVALLSASEQLYVPTDEDQETVRRPGLTITSTGAPGAFPKSEHLSPKSVRFGAQVARSLASLLSNFLRVGAHALGVCSNLPIERRSFVVAVVG